MLDNPIDHPMFKKYPYKIEDGVVYKDVECYCGSHSSFEYIKLSPNELQYEIRGNTKERISKNKTVAEKLVDACYRMINTKNVPDDEWWCVFKEILDQEYPE